MRNDDTYVSLFSGVGGLDLGLDRAGFRCVGQVENNPFCQQVLANHWSGVPRHDDVTTAIDWWLGTARPPVDGVAGGPPCQPVSLCGLGRAQDDERWLWDPMRDFVAAVKPRWVVIENVLGLRTRGLGIILHDLRELGYATRAGTIRACEVGAPHSRPRLFTLAYPAGDGRGTGRQGRPAGQGPHRLDHAPEGVGGEARAADLQRSGAWAAEPGVGRLAHGLPRGLVEQHIRALGNAVVPQVAERIGLILRDLLSSYPSLSRR